MTDSIDNVKAVVFDVFGTVVDWRSSIIAEGRALGRRLGVEVDWVAFADAWRAQYQPSMQAVRDGSRAWVSLDTLHRESLLKLLTQFAVPLHSDAEVDDFNRVWHRLQPWPDSVLGLQRLKRRYVIATLSNGNIALLVNMAKHAGLPWDAILGAEVAGAYKPLPQAYLRTCQQLGLGTEEVMLVAAHNDDLVQARSHGMKTAFVPRPTEYGDEQAQDLHAEHDFDFVARDFLALAQALGCPE